VRPVRAGGGFAAGGRGIAAGVVVHVIAAGGRGITVGGGRARDSRRACWASEAGAVYTVPLIVSRNEGRTRRK
jgi:hypothetical protein